MGCPVGAHTHGVQMSAAKQQELMGMIGTMVELRYIRMEEVPQIPQRKAPLQIAIYGPLEKMPCEADLVLVRGTAAQLMVLVEAAQAAGVAPDSPAMGRPTCAALPQALDSARPAVSLGCIELLLPSSNENRGDTVADHVRHGAGLSHEPINADDQNHSFNRNGFSRLERRRQGDESAANNSRGAF